MNDCEESASKTVVVLGAGRSGTSLLCGVLSMLGVDFGRRLIPADASNPRGYFESTDFIKLNESVYMELRPHDDMHALSFSEIEPYLSTHDSAFKNLLYKLLYSRPSERYGLKAWRVPLIELAIPHLIKPMFVVIHRDLDDTARSLKLHIERRKEHRLISFEECKMITKEYHVEIDKVLSRHSEIPSVHVTFEELTGDIESVCERLAGFMRVTLSDEMLGNAKKFVLPTKAERQKMARKASLLLPFRRVLLALHKHIFCAK